MSEKRCSERGSWPATSESGKSRYIGNLILRIRRSARPHADAPTCPPYSSTCPCTTVRVAPDRGRTLHLRRRGHEAHGWAMACATKDAYPSR